MKYQYFSKSKKIVSIEFNYRENHRFFPGGSMGRMIGIGKPNVLLFISYCEGCHYGGRRVLSFTLIKFDIIHMSLKIQT